MTIRAFLLTILACLPALASANQMPNDLSSDRADGLLAVSTSAGFGVGATVKARGTGPDQVFEQALVAQQDKYALDAVVKHPAILDIADLFVEHPSDTAARALVALAPKLNPDVARRAIEAMYCAQDKGMPVDKVIVVDMSAEASQKRLWAFDIRDLTKPRLVINERVAHGSGSDPGRSGKAMKFSNTQNSHMTSLGLYKISERYHGKNGWSRRLDGLFARFNGKARDRAVVMHPSTYVTPKRVGFSQGCPAVSQDTMDALEKSGMKNAVLWIDGPDKSLEKEVAACAEKRKAKELAQAAKIRQAEWVEQIERHQVVAYAPAAGVAQLALNSHGQEWIKTGMIGAMPEPAPRETALACELTMPRAPRFPLPDCLVPIDTMAFGHRIIR